MNLRRALILGPGALIGLVIALPAALSLHESWDLLFYLSTGRWILEHGFPAVDPFSPMATQAWFPHAWASCLAFEASLRAFGGAGPGLLVGLVLAIEVVLIGRLVAQAGGRGLIWLGLVVLAIGAQAHGLTAERAYHVGHLGFAAAVWLVLRWHSGSPWAAWALIPLTAVWANFHGSWIAGPALLGATVLGAAIDARKLTRSHWIGAGAAVLAWLAAAATPAGLATCFYPLQLFTGVGGAEIAEWHAWSLGSGTGRSLLVLVLVAAWALARSSRRPWAMLLPALGLLLATVRAERMAPLTGLFIAVMAAQLLSSGRSVDSQAAFWRPLSRLSAGLERWRAAASGAVWPALAVLGLGFAAAMTPTSLQARLNPADFPIRALEALCAQPPGRVLNTYRYGGAISGLCGPGHQVYIDGRNDPYPPEVHRNYRRLAMLEPGWREALAAYDPDYLLWTRLAYGSALLEVIGQEQTWRKVIEDRAGGLWVRVREQSQKPAAEPQSSLEP